ncbi:DUF4235 domain-containing protein [Streptomyces smyrnaeus]|uniref:DUF4235 domain-containing protein n=1 Tax=Streptomyces smyrnaeus TaxID=1387713 RepID=A0ABS3Y5H0_9ACTN|nr:MULTISPECIES: DUF4235 domain-containing protein [Streptomyces]MBO8202824.1 DUF4235 domain-containing protein [Streptomyces smyrnaeus]MBQ0868427.1 DUF4235 domain-containing protein [Streptomyces sp. RK75]MBQ1123485.1 DUF4235 domain-containing protein [Streptomyces sp. B15]MBQ1158942.1 DUF4235 domain-containing protein [Streptomyces sp. A73]
MNAVKIAYKPFGMLLGAGGGALAGAAFQRVWKATGHEEDAPEATDQDRAWREVLLAAALQGAIFAAVKAAVDRGGATTVHRLTGTWPS